MKVGFLADFRNPPPWERPWASHYGRTLELIEEAERLGAAAVFLGEHHLTDDGYLPQPLVVAAAIAARTRRIRIGTSVVLAPLRHAMHIAEEAALVDVLSDGRLELGLGAGYVPREFDAFGVDRAERYRLLDRSVGEVRRLLAEVVTPRPVQERVPIWLGYIGVGARRAGLMGEGLLSIQRECLQPYLDGLVAGGHDPATARMGGSLNLIVSDDPERDAARLRPCIEFQASAYAVLREDAERVEPPAQRLRGLSSNASSYKVLTPADAVSLIRHLTDGLPVEYVSPALSVGGMPDDLVERHISLTMNEVAPALRSASDVLRAI